jgi:hypothetical protein
MCGQPVGWLGFKRFFLIIIFVHLPGGGGMRMIDRLFGHS